MPSRWLLSAVALVIASVAGGVSGDGLNVSASTCFARTGYFSPTTGLSSTVLTYSGCFLASTLNVSTTSSGGSAGLPTLRFNASAPDNFTISCGAYCALEFISDANEAQFVVTPAGGCECVSPRQHMSPRAYPNVSAACPTDAGASGPYVRLYAVRPRCPLNLSTCGGGCHPQDGCCTPDAPPTPEDVPHLYVAMVQWSIVVILGIALIEAVVYSVLRCRRRRAPGGTHGFESDAELRSKTQAEALGERLLARFPAAPATSMLASSAAGGPLGDTCTICLEDMTTLPSAKLPCGHVLHTTCLREYLNHKLVNRNTVQCPMCRCVIADGSSA